MRKSLLSILALAFCFTFVVKGAIVTPYPETIEIKQINSAEKERLRLCQGHKKYDKQPTGFYVEAGRKVIVNVEILTPADQGLMPVLTVGTLGFNVDGRSTGVHTTLNAGLNTITNHSGGLIWLSFVQDAVSDPKGMARISFVEGSEHVRVPRFVFGVTTNMEFTEMLTQYTTPDVLFQSDHVVVAATREAANIYSKDNNKVAWLNAIHTLLDLEAEISGQDNNDPNPVHHRLKAGEVRFLLVENTFVSPHASSAGYTGYPSGSRNRYLTQIGLPGNNTWMLGHEIGHQHQQPAYQINLATESTVNIYSYVVERNIQGATYNRTTATRWNTARNTYLKLPFSKRVYDMDTDLLESIVGFNRDELRFMVWEQMFLIFGDQFYKTLHRIVREEKVTGGAADERRAYLIYKASQITGYDLTEFFNQWGIRVTDTAIKADLRAKMAYEKSKSRISDLSKIGRTAEDLVLVTGQALPAWAPIAMKGVTKVPNATTEIFDRTGWTVETSYEGVPDATVGGDNAENIIDANTTTAFAFVKPGKSYGGVTIPADVIPSFTIDMNEQKSFNSISYMHRLGNVYEFIRARQLSFYGSTNGTEFIAIKEHHVIDYVKNENEIIVTFPEVSYRYVKVVIEDWNKDSGSTVQVADCKVGIRPEMPEYPTPEPLKYKVNITADAGVVCSQAGQREESEDSSMTVNFTLTPDKNVAYVTVDGDTVSTRVSNDTYSFTIKVSNHLDINITSATKTTSLHSLNGEKELYVYPNPAKVNQNIRLSSDINFDNANVSVFNIPGEIISEYQVNGNELKAFDKTGVYFIRLKKGNDLYVTKLFVN